CVASCSGSRQPTCRRYASTIHSCRRTGRVSASRLHRCGLFDLSSEPAMITAHTDVVGSLLRPAALRKARDDWVAGRLSHAQFKSIEDRAVDEAVSLQEAAGLDIVTDGEMRRLSFQSQMTETVDGFGPWDIDAFLWGHWHGDGAVGEQ